MGCVHFNAVDTVDLAEICCLCNTVDDLLNPLLSEVSCLSFRGPPVRKPGICRCHHDIGIGFNCRVRIIFILQERRHDICFTGAKPELLDGLASI